MKWKMAENSLFAVLLRSPWWVSVLLASGVFFAMRFFLPWQYAIAGGLPFWVLAVVVGWKQLRAPSAEKVAKRLEALRAMSWEEFSRALEASYRLQGFDVRRIDGAADFELERATRLTLVAAKRWKAAVTGEEPLRALAAAVEKRGVSACVYVCAAELSDRAKDYAVKNRISRLEGAELAMFVDVKPKSG